MELGLALAAALHGGGSDDPGTPGRWGARGDRSHRPPSDGASSVASSTYMRDSMLRQPRVGLSRALPVPSEIVLCLCAGLTCCTQA